MLWERISKKILNCNPRCDTFSLNVMGFSLVWSGEGEHGDVRSVASYTPYIIGFRQYDSVTYEGIPSNHAWTVSRHTQHSKVIQFANGETLGTYIKHTEDV